jgi:hypothetical protein
MRSMDAEQGLDRGRLAIQSQPAQVGILDLGQATKYTAEPDVP